MCKMQKQPALHVYTRLAAADDAPREITAWQRRGRSFRLHFGMFQGEVPFTELCFYYFSVFTVYLATQLTHFGLTPGEVVLAAKNGQNGPMKLEAESGHNRSRVLKGE